MRRIFCAVAIAFAIGAATPTYAHQGNPNMESVVDRVTPQTKGVTLEVLNRDDRFEIVNDSSKTIVIEGYSEEPYARLLANGIVQVNERSPAYYLNDDRYANVEVPKSASAKASPQWTTVDKSGRFQWHDHRMHYMAKGVPSSVKDQSVRQKVFDYEIPIKIGGKAGAIDGTLFWTPQPGGGPPVAAVASFVALLLIAGAAVVFVRRRRGTSEKEVW